MKSPNLYKKEKQIIKASISQSSYEETNNNEHDWTTIKYVNVLCHNRTQKQLRKFL